MPIRSKNHGILSWGRRPRFALALLLGGVFLLSTGSVEAKKSYRYEDDPVRLGMKALEKGDLREAESYFEEAIANEHQVYRARFGLGEILYERGLYADAEPLYRQAIIEKNSETGNADFPEARAALGLVLLRLNRTMEAKEEFEQALREKGKLWEAHYGMARIALLDGDYSKAAKHLEKGKKKKGLKEREDLYHFGMALLQKAQGEIEGAEKHALAALHINPNDSEYGALVGEIYTERGALTLAIIEFEKVLQQPGLLVRAPVHHDLGVLYQREERYNDALLQYQEAVRKDSTFAVAWKDMAALYALANRHREAAQSYLRYTELRQDDPEGYLGLAKAALKSGLKRPAADAAMQAFSLDSTNVAIRLTLARASFVTNDKARASRLYKSLPDTTAFEAIDLTRMGQLDLDAKQFDLAKEHLNRAIEMDSTQADAYFALGLLHLNQADPESAVVRFREAIGYQPGHTSAYLNLGVALMRMQKIREAIAPLRVAVEAAPNYTPARVYLAMALVNSDSLSAAVVEYKTALEQDPTNAGALRGLGFCYLKRGNNGEAMKILKQATAADPKNADGWAMLGQSQALSGDMEAAAGSFEKALSINPEHPTAKLGLETVRAQEQ